MIPTDYDIVRYALVAKPEFLEDEDIEQALLALDRMWYTISEGSLPQVSEGNAVQWRVQHVYCGNYRQHMCEASPCFDCDLTGG